MIPNNPSMFIRNMPPLTKKRVNLLKTYLGHKNQAETITFLLDEFDKNNLDYRNVVEKYGGQIVTKE